MNAAITTQMPLEMLAQIATVAEERRVTRSEIMREAVAGYLAACGVAPAYKSKHDAARDAIVAAIEKAGNISLTSLGREVQAIPVHTRRAILRELTEAGVVVAEKLPGGGRGPRVTIYRINR